MSNAKKNLKDKNVKRIIIGAWFLRNGLDTSYKIADYIGELEKRIQGLEAENECLNYDERTT